MYLTIGEIPKAIEIYRKATKHYPEDPDLQCRLGLLYLQV